MRIKTNRNVGRIVLAGACAAALAVGSAVPAFAVDGTTSVTYSSSQQVPGANGWGFEIPTSIPFGADKAVSVDASVNLYNTAPGGSVEQIPDGDIPTGVVLYLKSANGFQLQKAAAPLDPVSYEITYTSPTGGTITTPAFTTATGTTKTAIGTFGKAHPAAVGTATRTSDASESGQHTDTLTFSYDDAKPTPTPAP